MKKLLLACMMVPVLGANAQTVKKVMLEDFTGVNCGWCPEGTVVIEGMEASMPTNFLPMAVHTGTYTPATSPLKTPEGDAVNLIAKPYGYPAGAVDRAYYAPAQDAKWTSFGMSRGAWPNAVAARLATTSIVSVSFSNLVNTSGDNYEMDVNVKFESAPAAGVPVTVNVSILESKIAAKNYGGTNNLSQGNASQSSVQGGASPLSNWFHNHTLRKTLGGAWGYTDVIPATPVVGTVYTKHISFSTVAGTTPVGWVKANIHLYAYVAYNGTTADKKEILNAEEVELKSFFPAAVNDVANNGRINSVYPNPATTTDVIKVEYNTVESGKITMNVINAIGQLVATPYVSVEVAGTHTIQWKASEHNLPAGVYLLQVNTPTGSINQRVNIQ